MKKIIVVMSIGCLMAAVLSGCCRLTRPRKPLNLDREFDIPPSLVWRMYQAHSAVRGRQLRENNAVYGKQFDVDEMLPLILLGIFCLGGTLLSVWRKDCYQQLR